MNIEELINRINELYHKSKSEGLTPEELDEQQKLRKEYIANVRGNLKSQLENIDIKEKDGSIVNLGVHKKKEELRKKMSVIRDSMFDKERKDASDCICEQLTAIDAYTSADVILMYSPIRSEVDCIPIFKKAIADGKQVAFPVSTIENDLPIMRFYYVDDLQKLKKGNYSVMEPDVNTYKLQQVKRNADLIIVPGLSFDRDCHRLGYGKGFYDSFLKKYPPKKSIGLGFEKQICDLVPTDAGDCAPDMVITEEHIYEKGSHNGF